MRRGSLLTRPLGRSYPYVIDDFESGNFSKWAGPKSSAFTLNGATPIGGSWSLYYTAANGNSTFGDGLQTPPVIPARGEIVELTCNSNTVTWGGFVLHEQTYNAAAPYYPTDGFIFMCNGSNYALNQMVGGSSTSLISGSLSTATASWRIRGYVNSATGSTNARRAEIMIYNYAGTTLLASQWTTIASGTLDAWNTQNFSIFAMSDVKLNSASYDLRIDNLQIVGRNV